MNAIQLLAAQPWVERLGWTLLHFLWQGVLLAGVYAAARKWAAGPDRRYLLACAALAGMAVAPVITWSMLEPQVASGMVVASPFVADRADVPPPGGGAAETTFPSAVRALTAPVLPWVVAVWLAGAMGCWFRLLGGWIGTVSLRSRLVRAAPGEWQQSLEQLKTRVRVSRPVRLLVSARVPAPAVVGWLAR